MYYYVLTFPLGTRCSSRDSYPSLEAAAEAAFDACARIRQQHGLFASYTIHYAE